MTFEIDVTVFSNLQNGCKKLEKKKEKKLIVCSNGGGGKKKLRRHCAKQRLMITMFDEILR
jgi:hypothetical protein